MKDLSLPTEKRLQGAVLSWAMEDKSCEIAVPNCRLMSWESDVLAATKAWFVHDVEIKVTRSDFKRDFEKRKHFFMSLENGHKPRANYFWFCTPEGLVGEEEIPGYAGWLVAYYGRSGWRVTEARAAPRLHTGKLHGRDKTALYRSAAYRLKNYHLQLYNQR